VDQIKRDQQKRDEKHDTTPHENEKQAAKRKVEEIGSVLSQQAKFDKSRGSSQVQ
jgi:hypothetical protein